MDKQFKQAIDKQFKQAIALYLMNYIFIIKRVRINNHMKIQFIVTEQQTVHSWCKEFLPHISYNLLQASLRRKDIIIKAQHAISNAENQNCKSKYMPNDILYAGDEIHVWGLLLNASYIKPNTTTHLTKNIELKIIDETGDYIIIDKQAGIPSQGGTGLQFAIADVLRDQYKMTPYIVHRLDKDVSGLLIIAKHVHAARKLSESLREMQWSKKYIAVLDADILPDPDVGTIEDDVDGKYAKTEYKYIGQSKNGIVVELTPVTGRKHQLRIHCAKYLAPIVGDAKYSDLMPDQYNIYRMMDDMGISNNCNLKNKTMNPRYMNNVQLLDYRQRIQLRCIYISFSFDGAQKEYAI